MKGQLLFLIIGLVFGYLIHDRLAPRQARRAPSEVLTVACPEIQTQPLVATDEKPIQMAQAAPMPVTEANRPFTVISPRDSANPSLAKSETQATVSGLILTEESISDMEKQLDQLRNTSSSSESAEGWRIQYGQGDRVFTRAGIRSGDLITYESLNTELQNPERARLAGRLIEVFNAIKR
jgi:hypothetical protein